MARVRAERELALPLGLLFLVSPHYAEVNNGVTKKTWARSAANRRPGSKFTGEGAEGNGRRHRGVGDKQWDHSLGGRPSAD
jgi:hypothetical protein